MYKCLHLFPSSVLLFPKCKLGFYMCMLLFFCFLLSALSTFVSAQEHFILYLCHFRFLFSCLALWETYNPPGSIGPLIFIFGISQALCAFMYSIEVEACIYCCQYYKEAHFIYICFEAHFKGYVVNNQKISFRGMFFLREQSHLRLHHILQHKRKWK